MNQRDLSEIKRRLNPDHNSAATICGCYMSSDGHVIARFSRAAGSLPQEENEKYMALFKRALSGTMGQNLLPVDFSNDQVMNGAEHRLLMDLRDSALKDDGLIDGLYERAMAYVQAETEAQAQSVAEAQAASNYLVLLLHDGYDVPVRNHNDELDREQSASVFSYILCCVCPVKQSRPALSYYAAESEFHSRISDWVVSAPELGFMFPAFEERGANIYRALYYTRDAADLHAAFAQSVFNAELSMTPAEQKETFQSILQETLAEDCNLETVQAVHETICTMLEERKADKNAEPLHFTQQEVSKVLEECGVPEARTAAFEERYSEAFGANAELPAVNMVSSKQFKVETPCVSIHVDPEHSDLIETRVIDGCSYILVRVDGDVEVNGMKINCASKN